MKSIYKFLAKACAILLLVFIASCADNEVEPLFDQSINERTEALKSQYNNVLTIPENGWIGYYSPNSSFGAYTMLMNFDEDGSLDIKSDYESGALDNVITYRIDKTLKVEIVLETFAVFHSIFEINNNDNDGEFVFNILSATAEEVVLESKLDFGDDITIFKLRPATAADLDLAPINTSLANIAGDGTQSVFRNISLNDNIIATFNFNSITRLTTVTYIKDGEKVEVRGPIAITATGFYFITPVDVNGTILSSFNFNEADGIYENTTDGLKIFYDNIPGLPLKTFDLLEIPSGMRYNYIETGRSSIAFDNFLNSFYDDIFADYGITVSRIYIRDAAFAQPYVHIYTNFGNIWFDINHEVKADGKIYFTLTGATNGGAFWQALFDPLLEVMFGSATGYYSDESGGLRGGSQRTFNLINADQPQYLVNYYTF